MSNKRNEAYKVRSRWDAEVNSCIMNCGTIRASVTTQGILFAYMDELTAENKRLRAVIEEAADDIDRYRKDTYDNEVPESIDLRKALEEGL